jgi:hypothetical protein
VLWPLSHDLDEALRTVRSVLRLVADLDDYEAVKGPMVVSGTVPSNLADSTRLSGVTPMVYRRRSRFPTRAMALA